MKKFKHNINENLFCYTHNQSYFICLRVEKMAEEEGLVFK